MERKSIFNCGCAAFIIGPFVVIALILTLIVGVGAMNEAQGPGNGQCIDAPGTLGGIPKNLNSIFTQAANHYDVDPRLVAVAYYVENRGYVDPPPPYGNGKVRRAVSPAGALGPFQFMPSTWRGYQSANPTHQPGNVWDIVDASYAAASLMRDLEGQPNTPLGSIQTQYQRGTALNVFALYNAGNPGNFQNRETQEYLRLAEAEWIRLSAAIEDGASPTPAVTDTPVSAACSMESEYATEKGVEGFPNTHEMTCKAGRDVGTHQTARGNTIRLCEVTNGGLVVNASISGQTADLIAAAREAGFELDGYGFRKMETQIRLRKQNCGTSHHAIYEMRPSSCSPPTNIPGRSTHEQGHAIDWRSNGQSVRSRNTAVFRWLDANAGKYGFKNLPSEPWHWSIDGH